MAASYGMAARSIHAEPRLAPNARFDTVSATRKAFILRLRGDVGIGESYPFSFRDVIARLKRLDLIGVGPRASQIGAPLIYVSTAGFHPAPLRDRPDRSAARRPAPRHRGRARGRLGRERALESQRRRTAVRSRAFRLYWQVFGADETLRSRSLVDFTLATPRAPRSRVPRRLKVSALAASRFTCACGRSFFPNARNP